MSVTPTENTPGHTPEPSQQHLHPTEHTVRAALRSPRLLRTEVLAGLVVALALIPEAISFSIIAGVDPQVGLFASFTMAVAISFLGGRPAMISAATGAIALVIAPVMRDYGYDYLIATVLLGGLMQLVLALVGVARLMRFVPRSVMVGFVNALPVFIASDPEWAKKFEDAGVPIVGDDIKSQVGATITHRVMARLFEDRGVTLDRTYQLNVGGNMDFKNMLERERLESKKVSKTQAVTANLQGELAGKVHDRNVHIGPSDHVEWLDDRKWAYVRLEGRAFGDAPLNLEYKLEVWDSPNSAGIIIDALRACKIAKDRGLGGPIIRSRRSAMAAMARRRSRPITAPVGFCRFGTSTAMRAEELHAAASRPSLRARSELITPVST